MHVWCTLRASVPEYALRARHALSYKADFLWNYPSFTTVNIKNWAYFYFPPMGGIIFRSYGGCLAHVPTEKVCSSIIIVIGSTIEIIISNQI